MISEKYFEFISKFASGVTRYPEDFHKLIEAYPEDIAASYLEQAKGVVEWLKQNEKLRLELLGIAAGKVFEPMEAIGYTPEEIEANKKGTFLEEILEYAKQ